MHLGEIQKFRNLNFSPLPKINLVLCFSKLKSNKSKYQSCAKIPWTRPGKVWIQTNLIWHSFGAVLPWDSTLWHYHLCDTTTLCTLPQTARLPHTNDKALLGEQILRSDHAQIREDLQPMGAWTRAEAKSNVFDLQPMGAWTPTIPDGDPYIAVILEISPTSSTTSPEQPCRR
jgi:hypothetical protein